MAEKISIYLAGPLFCLADRHQNLLLAKELEELGYLVILPQKEAIKFFDGTKFDVVGICEDCRSQSMSRRVVVANIDGTDADSGTSMEVGMAHATAMIAKGLLMARSVTLPIPPVVICFRTDFRTSMEHEVGYNAMFNLADKLIYKPAYVNSLEEIATFYKELAQEIDEAIKEALIKRFVII